MHDFAAQTGSCRRAQSFVILDILRGVAAISVVVLHFRPIFAPIRAAGGYRAVDLFFVISGFVLAHAYDGRLAAGMPVASFLRARFVRLFPFYLLALLLGVAELAYLSRHLGMTDIIAASTIFGLFMFPTPPIGFAYDPLFPANVVCWTLFCELCVNALYAASRKWQSIPALVSTVAAAACALVAIAVFRGTLNGGGFWGDAYVACARTLFSFFAGVLLFRLGRPRRAPDRRMATGIAVAVVGLALFWPFPAAARGLIDVGVVLFVFPAVVLLATARAPEPCGSLDRLLGEISYPIYVLQMPLLTTMIIALDRLFPTLIARTSPWIGIGALIALATGSLLLVRWWDQPLRRWIGRWGAPRGS